MRRGPHAMGGSQEGRTAARGATLATEALLDPRLRGDDNRSDCRVTASAARAQFADITCSAWVPRPLCAGVLDDNVVHADSELVRQHFSPGLGSQAHSHPLPASER
jgi:hypothetical protein